MRKSMAIGLAAAALSLCGAAALAAAEFKIVTASARGTYIQIGRDIASYVAPQADSISTYCLRQDRPRTFAVCATNLE